jgi:hypothetical protein
MSYMKLNASKVAGLAATAMLLGSSYVSAHHSFAMFDRKVETVLTGTVKEFQWSNPHAYIQVISDQDGNNWSIEGGGVNGLMRSNWRPKSLVPGDKITVHMHPLRNGAYGGELMWVKKADGTILGDGRPPEPAAGDHPATSP